MLNDKKKKNKLTKNIINNPLASWNNGSNKKTIINVVESVIDLQNPKFVEPKSVLQHLILVEVKIIVKKT